MREFLASIKLNFITFTVYMYGYKGSELNSFAPSYEGFKMILVLVILLSKAVEAIESSAYWC
jgi:hypothetical protein